MLVDALAERLSVEPDLVVDPPRPLQYVVLGLGCDPDVVLVDRASVRARWHQVIEDLLERTDPRSGRTRLVVLAGSDEIDGALDAARAGAAAWLQPGCGADELVQVLRLVGRGHAFYPSAVLGPVLAALYADLHAAPETDGPLATLSLREREVLGCLVEGRNSRTIATVLEMADNTVRTHTARIFRKLGVHSRVEAVRIAHEAGFSPGLPTPVDRRGGDGASAPALRSEPVEHLDRPDSPI